jgi:hypothetical protein
MDLEEKETSQLRKVNNLLLKPIGSAHLVRVPFHILRHASYVPTSPVCYASKPLWGLNYFASKNECFKIIT